MAGIEKKSKNSCQTPFKDSTYGSRNMGNLDGKVIDEEGLPSWNMSSFLSKFPNKRGRFFQFFFITASRAYSQQLGTLNMKIQVFELRSREGDPWTAIDHSLMPKGLRSETSTKAPQAAGECIQIFTLLLRISLNSESGSGRRNFLIAHRRYEYTSKLQEKTLALCRDYMHL